MALLRDGVWQSIGAILGFIAIIVSVWIFYRQRQVKRLDYTVTTLSSFLPTNVQGNLRLIFDGKDLSNPYIAFIRIQNQGNVPIPKIDYEQPLVLDTGDLVTVIAAGALEEHTKRLGVNVESVQGTKIQFSSVLLNPGDYYDIQLILEPTDPLGIGVIETQGRNKFVDEVKQMINLSGRVVGVTEIKRGIPRPFFETFLMIRLLFVSTFLFSLFTVLLYLLFRIIGK